jgi:hypothetical protein
MLDSHPQMLTRHLYRYDEVRAALLWCIFQRRLTDGMFWVQELLDSECYTELYQVLFEGWLWSVGISRLEWFRQFWILFQKDTVDEEELVLLANTLLRLPMRDSTVFHLLLRGPTSQWERLPPTPKTDAFLSTIKDIADTPAKQDLLRCFRLGKVVNAWLLACQLFQEETEERVWDFLSRIELRTIGSPSTRQCFEAFYTGIDTLFPEDQTIRLAGRAVAIAHLCLSPSLQNKSNYNLPLMPLDSYTESSLKEWRELTGRRKRRVLSPPSECLGWITSRGCNPYTKTTIKEVRTFTIDVLREKGCSFWQTRLDESDPWKDDDAFEEFWDTYFPDDIPDEWSLADQTKSHGPGPLRPTETLIPWRLSTKWFLRIPSLLLWNPIKELSTLYEQPCWKELKVWTSEYESGYGELKPPETTPSAKAMRFQILT